VLHEWLDGAAVLLRSDAIRDAGMLDEDYFLYFEDTEYLLKLRRLGWLVECIPAAVAWQERGTGRPTSGCAMGCASWLEQLPNDICCVS
jgi:N-acetylglucosaminyl-diphospho-decaprenol L-rhamnosyltransferase